MRRRVAADAEMNKAMKGAGSPAVASSHEEVIVVRTRPGECTLRKAATARGDTQTCMHFLYRSCNKTDYIGLVTTR